VAPPDDPARPWRAPLAIRAAFRFEPARVMAMRENELAQSVLGTATGQSIFEIVSALIDRDSARGLDLIHQALDAGSDPRQFARQWY
jgi:hypothetical protein